LIRHGTQADHLRLSYIYLYDLRSILSAISTDLSATRWEIVDRYIDAGTSSAKGRDKRPELDRMMKDPNKRKFDLVMTWCIDRLGPSLKHLMEILSDLDAKNIYSFLWPTSCWSGDDATYNP
jgi:DNA invertase Pin-like site-specific DNA recombinase